MEGTGTNTTDKPGRDRSPIEKVPPKFGQISHVVAVMSGKGGVGKSTVSALLALGLARAGLRVGILDADVTGPSIPRMFGLGSGLEATPEGGILPATAAMGIKVISLNLLLPNEDDPVIWRGPLISGTVKQFWEEVVWGDLDWLVVDLPPGTGDVPLTVLQVIPLDGIVIVSSPQDLALMVVRKAINMARAMNIPLLGLIENMSYVTCPKCGEKTRLFGPSRLEEVAAAVDAPVTAALPLDPALSALCDTGQIAVYEDTAMNRFVDELLKLPVAGAVSAGPVS